MEDLEDVTIGDPNGVTIDVTVEPEPAPEPASETVVVVEAPQGDGSMALVELNHERRITLLEARMSAVEGVAATASVDAEVAIDLADQAVEAAAETDADIAEVETVVDEVVADDLADDGVDVNGDGKVDTKDVPPNSARRHWLFRSRDEWKRN